MNIREKVEEMCAELPKPPFIPEKRDVFNITLEELLNSADFTDLYDSEKERIAATLIRFNVQVSSVLLHGSLSWIQQRILQRLRIYTNP